MRDAVVADDDLSAAIIALLGWGTSSHPRSRVQETPGGASPLEDRAQAAVTECLAIAPDWTRDDLPTAGRRARAEMAARHPELSSGALDALAWAYTYNWR